MLICSPPANTQRSDEIIGDFEIYVKSVDESLI